MSADQRAEDVDEGVPDHATAMIPQSSDRGVALVLGRRTSSSRQLAQLAHLNHRQLLHRLDKRLAISETISSRAVADSAVLHRAQISDVEAVAPHLPIATAIARARSEPCGCLLNNLMGGAIRSLPLIR